VPAQNKSLKLFIASSNPGKLREYRALASAANAPVEISLLPDFDLVPSYEEAASTFAENAAGKALYYSRFSPGLVLADDSGLVVRALGGAPGVHSARYAGANASDADRIHKLLHEMSSKKGEDRRARFVCVLVLAETGEARGIFSADADGTLLEAPQGQHGFGYDPIFFFPPLGKTFAEVTHEEKNLHSHRGKAFHKALDFLLSEPQVGPD
jgi:XTP/dITP diphosphohydrolase